ncbi:MAG: UDP-N-acetylmuramoyl-L-alanine--D-glutamate ligase [Hyphomicrobiaceae bacterium]
MATLSKARKVAIWGIGREGKQAIAYVRERCPDVVITAIDDKALGPIVDVSVDAVLSGESGCQALARGQFDVVIKSPGVSLYRPEIEGAVANGTVITSATNLWFEDNPTARTVIVTGTKGKSTTTRLLAHLLQSEGADVAVLGNVGSPPLGQHPGRDFTVFELSSYQLADFAYCPTLMVLTNLYKEHVPWHGSVERYFLDKLQTAKRNSRLPLVANAQDANTVTYLKGRRNTVWYNVESGYHSSEGQLLFGTTAIPVKESPLKGEHNLSNLAAAATAFNDLTGKTWREDAPIDLCSFRQLDHRMQEFDIGGGVLCVNDSIATVPEATLAVLQTYPNRPKILLLGGSDRQQDYGPLLKKLPELGIKALCLLPDTGARIADQLERAGNTIPVRSCITLADAVSHAVSISTSGDIILLSPAAPSFTQFKNFEERGKSFMDLCSRLKP